MLFKKITLPIDVNINRLKSAKQFLQTPINYTVEICTDVSFNYSDYRFLFVRDHVVNSARRIKAHPPGGQDRNLKAKLVCLVKLF